MAEPSRDWFGDEGYEAFLTARRSEILDRVSRACSRAGRTPDDVVVEAVSKTVDIDAVEAAMDVGWDVFGENRPQELARKRDAIDATADERGLAAPRFDMIGNLQKNKINQVLGRASLIHSVSSSHLAGGISTRAQARGMVAQVLLEVNVSGEDSKSGFSPVDVMTSFDDLMGLEGISIQGLMTMAPAHDPDAARATFSGLRSLAERLRSTSGLALPVLSCGMSDDFEIAVEEGSTLVRLGRVVFSKDYELAENRC
ncbi:MAG: YggS family pyridoxal phosphate-dependent enzyme [Atopobiaceae bacterium]|jgi:pyridoxal phosphate enzyme (YggS family)|nr:YggS family pyridoxal phosphate-dependent enzyme [Atopobiaceae bacterium]MCI2173377.1 YggS family pyridoxal phosphate-dependent enzyme [Atopobiaceae bacterium]MCI2207372.1 YggS family pyridoxal phosphate-dependent enzyme [Atopobiaceae bacterium]